MTVLTPRQQEIISNISPGADQVNLGALMEQALSGVLPAGSITPGEIGIADTKIVIGNGSAVGAAYALSGDVTMTNLGVVTIGTIRHALTVGINDTGYDVKFFGATAGSYMLWDESEDTLNIQGNIITGVDDTGFDVTFYGATADKKWRWVADSDMMDIDGIVKIHNRPVTTDTYALEVKLDFKQSSGTGQGALQSSTRVYPTTDTTTQNAQGGYSQIQLHSGDSMTGAAAMCGWLGQVHNDGGTINGTGTYCGIRASIADGGTWTAVGRLCALHVVSSLDQAVSSGAYSLMYIQNAGAATVADAIAIDGSDSVTALMTLTNVAGAAAVANGSILNDISGTANDGYIKLSVEGEDKYIALYDLKA